MIELSSANLAAFFAQILIVVALAAAGARLFDVPLPRVRLGYWRAVVILCLVLPLISPRQTRLEPSSNSVVNATVAATSGRTVGAPAGSETRGWRPSEEQLTTVLLVAILTGILVRAVWLTVGFIRLRRLRRTSIAVSVDAEADRLRIEIAPRTDIRLSADLQQPVTFGLIRPVILLSDRALALPELERHAVICHELVHVRRRDWAWTLVEEALRSMFWFHPAMRFALARVQASREELVDADVIARTGARQEYMRALLSFADRSDLALAPSFVGRSQLTLRLRRITEEVQISRGRLSVAVFSHVSVLLGAIALASLGLPYDVRAQQQPDPPPRDAVTFTMPLSRAVVRMDRPTYPSDAWQAGIGAEVSMLVTVSTNGSTTVQGDPVWRVMVSSTSPADAVQSFWARQGWRDFIESVNEAVRQWQFVPADSDVTVGARVSFQPPLPSASRYRLGMATYFELADMQGRLVIVQALQERYRAVNPAAVIDLQTFLPVGSLEAPLRVGGDVREPQRVYGISPVYPEAAKATRVQGDVLLEVLIGVDGTVQDVRVLRSIPLLDQAALDTVRTWVFSTTVVDGVARLVITNVTVNFTLPDQQ